MDTEKFKSDLMIGETSSVEFKRCRNEVEHDVFESICAFLNRFGGDIYLGCIDRLGSGVRNLYKYSKDYGGADPIFTEGNNFVISVSLKKLDSIRFPFEKQPVGGEKPQIGDEKQSIGTGELHIGAEDLHIGSEKLHIESALAGLDVTQPTKENILRLFQGLGTTEIFGRSEVCKITGLQERAASYLLGAMLRYHLLDTVKGHGKGKYRFRVMDGRIEYSQRNVSGSR